MASKSSPAPPSSRLIITKLVLENFKSYAGVQEIGLFHKSFSCVVGPNGSGKSNVIDAMLFVFGYRAKQLRLNKVSELIHKSENYTNLESAKVSVHFVDVNADGNEVAGTEMVLTRTAHRDNSSKYFLNTKTSSFQEVTDLLRQRGIDLDHNRFLILQGEVEQISMMKPKAQSVHEEGLLNYLEDIIGSNKYIEQIEEASKVFEALNEARVEKLARCKVSEKEKEALEGSKIEAEDYIRKTREIDTRSSVLCQLTLRDTKKKAAEADTARKAAEEQVEAERARMKETHNQLAELEKTYQKEAKEHEMIATEMQKAKSDFAVFERKDIKLREDLKNSVTKEKKIAASIDKEKAKNKEASLNVDKYRRDIVAAESDIAALKVQLAKEEAQLDKLYESLKQTTGPLLLTLDGKKKELMPLREKVDVAQSAVNVLESEIALLLKKTTAMESMIEEVRVQTETATAKLANLKKEEAALVARESATQDKIATLQGKKADLEKQEQSFSRLVKEKRAKMESAKSSHNEVAARSHLLTGIMQAVKKGKLKGVFGRLGDLGIIDQKYDVAISTACAMLDHILVETADDGQKCVEYLKANNLGRATFHMLDKITATMAERMNSESEVPANVSRLFDLVTPREDRFKPVFKFALGETLVASTLEVATKVAFGGAKRFRVVTLDGKLIDASGTMSGGGNKVARGGMAFAFSNSSSSSSSSSLSKDADGEDVASEKDLVNMQKDIDQAIVGMKKAAGELEVVKTELAAAQEELQKITGALMPKCKMETESLSKLLVELQERIPSIKKQYKVDPAEVARLKECEADLVGKKKEYDKMKLLAKAAEEAVEAVQKEIDDVGGMRLKTQKAKVEGINSQIDTCNSTITKAQVQVKATDKGMSKASETIAEFEDELQKLNEAMVKGKAELSELETEAGKVMEAFNSAKQLLDDKAQLLQKAKTDYEKLKVVVEKARSIQVDLENKLEDCLRTQREHNERVKQSMKELASLKKRHEKEMAAIEEDVEALDADSQEELTKMADFFRDLSDEELDKYNKTDLNKEIAVLEENLQSMKPNMGAIKAYSKKAEEYKQRVAELDEATQKRDEARKAHDTLRKQRLDEFMTGFSFITMKLKEMYQMITLGGDAELELVDSLDPFSEGIVFSVRPPKKSWKNIQNLSGGEKTLSSLALVFALHQFKPTPLYVMDEIDAALDFKNVSIVANYLKERTKDAQFIIISLRNNMFELADRLIGIYKTDNATKSVTIDPAAFVIPTVGSSSSSAQPTSVKS